MKKVFVFRDDKAEFFLDKIYPGMVISRVEFINPAISSYMLFDEIEKLKTFELDSILDYNARSYLKAFDEAKKVLLLV